MRPGKSRVSRSRKTSGTPIEEEKRSSGGKRVGKSAPGNYRGKRTGDASFSASKPHGKRPAGKAYGDKPYSKPFGDRKRSYSKPDGERPAGKPYGDKPYSKPGGRPYGDKKRSYGKPDGRFSKDKPRFNRDGNRPYGERSSSFKKPYSKFPPAIKPPFIEGEAPREERPAGNYRSGRPYSKTGDRKPFGDKRRSFSKPEGRFPADAASGDKPKWNRKEKHEFYGDKKKRTRTFGKQKPAEEPKISDGTIRLNKYISNAGICSRREADELITAGVISVNGNVITTLGYKVQPGDVVKYNDAKLKSEKPVYLLLNKPKDFITTVDDPQNRNTVMSLIRNACKERVYPVGRLDRNTTGLLLFTNDGDLADKLTHPSFEVQKVYEVHLDKNLKQEHFEEIANGLTLEDGTITPDEISYAPGSKSVIGIELHSGRNRIVRRIFEHLGYRVTKLDRVLYAGLTKKDLPRGRWRFLTELELASLKMITGNKRLKAAPQRISMAEE